MPGVLDGVRVVELASWTFVPAAGVVLADWGADVIKVEDVRSGDPGRALVISGLTRGSGRADADYMQEMSNRGKRSIGLDLRTQAGRAAFDAIIRTADVFLTNWLPDARASLGLDVDDLRAVNPRIIYARGSGQGPLGPDAGRGGFDAASFTARGGYAYALTPDGQEQPLGQRPALGDLPSGLTLAGGVAAALFRRERTGEGSVVDMSLLAQSLWTIAPDVAAADMFGLDKIPFNMATGIMNPLATTYRTSDGRWIQFAFLQLDRFWRGFTARIGRPELADDPRFADARGIVTNAATVKAILTEVFAAHDLAHWRKVLQDEEGVWSVVQTPQECLDDPQAVANGYVLERHDEKGSPFRVVASPITFDQHPIEIARNAPEHGQHTEELLLELGYDWPQILQAKEAGAVL